MISETKNVESIETLRAYIKIEYPIQRRIIRFAAKLVRPILALAQTLFLIGILISIGCAIRVDVGVATPQRQEAVEYQGTELADHLNDLYRVEGGAK